MDRMTMSPCYFDVLMHYYVSPEEHPSLNTPEPAPSYIDAVEYLIDHGLLCERAKDDREFGGTYRATDRGTAYVIAALSTPLPEQRWIVPTRECA